MYYKAHQSTRTDMKRLKNDILRKSYSNELTAKIESVDDLDTHARKIEDAIKETAGTTVPVKRPTKKTWTSGQTLKLVDEKRTRKPTKDASKGKSRQHKNLCKQVKKTGRQDKEY